MVMQTERYSKVQLKCDGTRWRVGGEVKGKPANGVGSQYSSHYLQTWCIHITTTDTHTLVASSRPNWHLHRFKWARPFRRKMKFGFCMCAIIFQMQSTNRFITLALGGRWWAAPHCFIRMIHDNHFISKHGSSDTHIPVLTLLISLNNMWRGNVMRINYSIYEFEKLNARNEIQTTNTNTNSNK